MNSENVSNNDISTYKLCERCKREQATINCSQCSPLQNFCKKCDSVIHSLPSKISHIRNNLNTFDVKNPIEINNNINPDLSTNYISKSNLNSNYNIKPEIQINTSNNPIDSNPLYYLPSSNLQYIEQPNRIRSNDFKQTFTKDYVTELNNIHLKEKNELLFKISSLENTLNRLKNTLGEHINKMQETIDDNNKESNKKIKELEEENEFKFRKMENDKNLEIDILKDELNNLKNNNNELLNSIKNLEEEKNLIESNLTNQINDLNQQIINIKMEAENNQRNSNELNEQMKREYDNKINSILSDREREINEMTIKHKFELENLNNDLINLKKDNRTK